MTAVKIKHSPNVLRKEALAYLNCSPHTKAAMDMFIQGDYDEVILTDEQGLKLSRLHRVEGRIVEEPIM